MSLLDDDKIAAALASLDGWEHDGDTLTKTYDFEDFTEAIAFITNAAPRIDELDHHPTWTNTYGTVEVVLSSHDAGGVTQRDLTLARALEDVASTI